MRLARAEDFRRRLETKSSNWTTRLIRISFAGIPSLGEGDIPIALPLTVFCGPNGVGKTTLLRAIWATLDPAAANESKAKSIKLAAGTATVALQAEDQPVQVTAIFANGKASSDREVDLEVIHIDTSSDSGKLQDDFATYENVDDIINGVGARVLTERELSQINYLTKRDYREAKLFEVETANGIAPFFEVTLDANRYDSRTMGAGEFAAFYLWWHLARVTPNSVILIEEPETFLSPKTQGAFTDHLLAVMYAKKICVVMTSHSGELITPLPESCIRFLRREPAGVRLVTDAPSPILLDTIGIKTPVDTLVFVEDEGAENFCRLWIEQNQPYMSHRMKFVVKGGEGPIVSVLRSMDRDYGEIKVLGLFDGDQRGKIPNDVAEKALFLPGDSRIERLFRGEIIADPLRLTTALGGRDVSDVLFGLQGADDHDWFLGLAKGLSMHPSQTFMLLYGLWMEADANKEAAKVAFAAFRTAIEPIVDLRNEE